MKDTVKTAQVRVDRVSPSYWRVVMNNPPLNLMGPEFVLQLREIVDEIESDEQLRVIVFESAVDGFFLNHSDFNAKLEDLTGIPEDRRVSKPGRTSWRACRVRRLYR